MSRRQSPSRRPAGASGTSRASENGQSSPASDRAAPCRPVTGSHLRFTRRAARCQGRLPEQPTPPESAAPLRGECRVAIGQPNLHIGVSGGESNLLAPAASRCLKAITIGRGRRAGANVHPSQGSEARRLTAPQSRPQLLERRVRRAKLSVGAVVDHSCADLIREDHDARLGGDHSSPGWRTATTASLPVLRQPRSPCPGAHHGWAAITRARTYPRSSRASSAGPLAVS